MPETPLQTKARLRENRKVLQRLVETLLTEEHPEDGVGARSCNVS